MADLEGAKIAAAIKATEYKYFGDYEMSDDQRDAVAVLVEAAKKYALRDIPERRPRPYCDWIEDYGDVLWWRIPIDEAPHVGTPLDTAWPWENCDTSTLWWTPLPDAKRIEDQVPL